MVSQQIRQDFPILTQKIRDKPLVYFDNAATTQKPTRVLDAINNYYLTNNANVSRGVHTLGERATNEYEKARKTVATFLNVQSHNIIFTASTTDSVNRVAQGFEEIITKDDEVLLSVFEHHTNILPWQVLAKKTGATLVYCAIKDGVVDLDDYKKKLTTKTKIVCVSATSNVLGTNNDVETIARLAHKQEAYVLVDYAQTIAHKKVDASNADFAVFSAHKMYGPMGIGCLIMSDRAQEVMKPTMYGGGMIDTVTKNGHTITNKPWCYEAGTPNVAGAVGLASAIDYLNNIGLENIQYYEEELTRYALEKITTIQEIVLLNKKPRAPIISFTIKGVSAHDIAQLLDLQGIAVRSGTHCTSPLHEELSIQESVRISFGLYNTTQEIDYFLGATKKVLEQLRRKQ